jgi:hypothetical protein
MRSSVSFQGGHVNRTRCVTLGAALAASLRTLVGITASEATSL